MCKAGTQQTTKRKKRMISATRVPMTDNALTLRLAAYLTNFARVRHYI